MPPRFRLVMMLITLAAAGCSSEDEVPFVADPPFPPAPGVEVVVFEGEGCRLLFPVSIVVLDAESAIVRFRGELAEAVRTTVRDGEIHLGEQVFAGPIVLRLEPLTGEQTDERVCIGVRTEAGTNRYRGALRLEVRATNLRVINLLNLEQYLVGVLAAEMPLLYPLEALKAQAVAARTFALYELVWQRDHAGLRPFSADTSFQVYRGVRDGDHRAVEAVITTAGEVLFYRGALFRSYFHSTCGGATLPADVVFGDAGIPPLEGAECGSCLGSSMARWESRWSVEDVEAVLVPWARGEGEWIGTLQDLEIADLDDGGRVRSVLVRGAAKSVEISAARLRRLLHRDGRAALHSSTFSIDRGDGDVVFRGQGFGHRVGLCQVGAGERGASESYQRILGRYYPESELLSMRSLY